MPGDGWSPVEQDVGERLVVPHQHVEARPQALDQVGFEQQRLDLGAGDDELHRRGLAHHPADAVGVEAALRVVGDALLQAARLADIEHVAGRVHHAVDARRVGQPLDQRLDDLGADLAVGVAGMRVPVDRGEGRQSGPARRRLLDGGVVLVDLVAGDDSRRCRRRRRRAASACRRSCRSGSFHHACHIRRLPGKMLAAVERDHLAGHRARLARDSGSSRRIRQVPARASGSARRPAPRNPLSSCRAFGRVGPGPMALTRMRGASACAIVCVAVHSADFDSV